MTRSHADLWARLEQRARAIELPKEMLIGTATAAYQIEGAVAEDGRGQSIWDAFVRRPGVIADGTSGEVACDHYHRVPEDIALMTALNHGAYRFSIAWPRILPSGRGVVSERGLSFYDRLADALLAHAITPFATLYHWDLPQALQDEGAGWLRRGIVDDYLAYVDVVTRRLGDRVKHWTTFNELWTFTWSGYGDGTDAPGLVGGPGAALTASHHALLAHGHAVPMIRANVADAKVGIVLDVNAVSAASDTAADVAAAQRFDGCQNRWYLDALFKGAYPADMLALFGPHCPSVEDGDLATIAVGLDYLGVNVYRRSVIAAGDDWAPVNIRRVRPAGTYTSMGWEVWPRCLYDILADVHRRYAPPALYITENGAAFADAVAADGAVDDAERADYIVSHLEQVAAAVGDGMPLRGYFAWTLLDNFEWAEGYRQRFGLVHVDFATQKRTIKASGRLFAIIAASVRGDRDRERY